MAVLYALLGLILFAAPAQSSTHFAWKVSPFVTMTIGAWCLGNAWSAGITARRWEWRLVRTALAYLWLFGILQAAVLIVFRDKLQLGSAVAWLYVVTVVVSAISAVWGAVEWVRGRPRASHAGKKMTGTLRLLTLGFVLFVVFIAIYGTLVPMGGRGTNGTVFPEVMSPFTLRSFAVFYLALAVSAAPLLWLQDRGTLLHHALASSGLLVMITIATFVYIDRFNFAERPLGLLYIGAYVVVGVVVGIVMLIYGTGVRQPSPVSVRP
jgi:hypothetical protein